MTTNRPTSTKKNNNKEIINNNKGNNNNKEKKTKNVTNKAKSRLKTTLRTLAKRTLTILVRDRCISAWLKNIDGHKGC